MKNIGKQDISTLLGPFGSESLRLFEMTKILGALIIVSILFLFGQGKLAAIFRPNYVEAIGDLFVDFGVPVGQPVFNTFGMKPGDSVTKTIIVTNDAPSNRPIGIKAIKTNGVGELENMLEITISKGGTDLYGGTTGTKILATFFTDSNGPVGIPLSLLAPAQTADYKITVKFKQNAGNEFQHTNVVFTIQIGIAVDIPVACQSFQLNSTPILGTKKSEILTGTPGNDLIIGFEGNDIIDGKGGNDCIIGGSGNDVINGGAGNDYLQGDDGSDVINGGSGLDSAVGGAGQDVCGAETTASCEIVHT